MVATKFLSLVTAAAAVPLQRVIFPEDVAEAYGARCLDGSPGGYYVREVSGSSDWVFFMEGGGLCITPFDCKKRLTTGMGSSTFWEETHDDDSNVLNDDPAANPFAGFNAVYFRYCSGDTHIGALKGKNRLMGGLYTSGHFIVEAALDHLYNTTSLGRGVGRALLTGSSAGGIGVLHSADWLTETVTEKFGFTNAVVKASPQAGLYFPSQPKKGVCVFQEYALLGEHCPRVDNFEAWWVERLVEHAYANTNCMRELKNARRCWNAGILARYVSTPLFLAQNRYDQNQLAGEMLCSDCSSNSSEASSKVKSYMAYFGNRSEEVLRDLESNFNHSVFMPNCYKHTGNLCMKGGPRIDGHTYNSSLSDWFFNDVHHAHYDDCGEFPCSEVCDCSNPRANVLV